jgi:hypothetical protein
MKTTSRGNIYLVALLVVACAHAWGGVILEVGHRGKVYYRPESAPVTSTGLSISELIVGAQQWAIQGSQFRFRTGAYEGRQGSSLVYTPGGRFVISGCVDSNGDHDHGCDREDIHGVLMTGTFLDAKLVQQNGETILIAQFVDQVNPILAKLLKLPTKSEGVLDLILAGGRQTRWTIDGVNSGTLSLLSEPSSIMTLGADLAGLFLLLCLGKGRRRIPDCAEGFGRS